MFLVASLTSSANKSMFLLSFDSFKKNRVFYEEYSPDITVILNKKDKRLFTSSLKSASEFLKYSDEMPTYYSAEVKRPYGMWENIIESELINIDKVSLRLVHVYGTYAKDVNKFYEERSEEFRLMIMSNRHEKVYQCEVMEII